MDDYRHQLPAARRRNGTRRTSFVGRLRPLWYALLFGECLVVLVPSIYSREAPTAWGIPFFYWFQIVWIVVSIFVTGLVYLLTKSADLPDPGLGDGS